MKKTKKKLALSSETLRRVVGGEIGTHTCDPSQLVCPSIGCPPDTQDLRCTRISKWFIC